MMNRIRKINSINNGFLNYVTIPELMLTRTFSPLDRGIIESYEIPFTNSQYALRVDSPIKYSYMFKDFARHSTYMNCIIVREK